MNQYNRDLTTTLILKPIARAVAGSYGKAISNPLSKAILRKGQNAKILFEPEAFAIAGPGGIAHAQSDLEIFYENYNSPKITLLPYYGGLRGQSLQIIENPNGTVTTTIIKTADRQERNENFEKHTNQDLHNIHETALNIIRLQEKIKTNGRLNAAEEEIYEKNLEILNDSAQNLSKYYDPDYVNINTENREGLTEWFERKKSSQKDKNKKKQKEEAEEEKKKKKGSNKEEEEEEEEEVEENEDEGIAIGLPPDNASVAEAKPVGLAVAGDGGVAASKPMATAVVGPGGLAIARPVGTAIAGVSPDQALVPIYVEGLIGTSKPKRYNSSQQHHKVDNTSEYLNKIINKYHQI